MAALKPKVREELVIVEIDGEAVLYDPNEVLIHHLNPTATVLLKLCDGSGTVRQIAEDIADVLDLPQERVIRQVRHMVGQFKRAGLLDGHTREEPLPTHVHSHSHSHDSKAEEPTNG